MNEYEVATNQVLPHLLNTLSWPADLVSAYGRVPVQIGTSTVWADFVFYISRQQMPVPWLLVEVKQPGSPLEQTIPQAESYSLILDAPFFCVTDGAAFHFYATGRSQGTSIGLQGPPPTPSPDYLRTGVEHVSFPPQLDDLVSLFLIGLRNEKAFFEDTKWHDDSVKHLNDRVFERLHSLSPQELKDAITHHMMIKLPNRNAIFSQIDQDFARFTRILTFIRDFAGDPINNINKLMDKTGTLYVRGGGIFFITQLLAGAHPNEYVVLEENVSKALRQLGITDILVKQDTANGYIYINEICKKLFKDKIEDNVREYGFGLAAVHNFLWHWYVYYRTKGIWEK